MVAAWPGAAKKTLELGWSSRSEGGKRCGLHLDDVWPIEYAKAVTVPTLVAQVHHDFLTKPSNVQEIYDAISAKDKKLFWVEGTDLRFEGYNYFGKHPQLVLEWFDSHMQ